LIGGEAGLGEAELDRFDRELVIVLLSGEPLFLGRRDDLTVNEQRCCAVVVKG
jgi:hypothetical protein